jgi:succinate dehydrogenase/fumarate reductase flavoprotein subunit
MQERSARSANVREGKAELSAADLRVDVLVLGAGMAGMAAAAEAAGRGASVGVVEKLAEIGGSAALSAGILWAPRSYAEMRERMPGAEPDLARALTADFPDALESVRATGIEASEIVDGPYFGFGTGRQVDIAGLMRHWLRKVEGAGGWVVRETPARALRMRDDGRVCGAVVEGPDGRVAIEAGAVILATGGFVGDPQLVAGFVGPNADRVLVRANPGSVGDGFRLGQSAGGAASRSLSTFYGHLVSYPIRDWGEVHFLPLTQYHSIHCILVNRHGRRFIDESLGDEITNQALLGQPDGRAILLADEDTRRRFVVTAPYPHGEVVDRFAAAAEAGANYIVADSLSNLVAAVASWGVPAATLRASLDAYDRAVAGEDVSPDAPMPAVPAPLRVSPFHAIEVQPAITLPYGGLRIDADARLLDRDNRPVPGLYAAGADAGGVYHVGYGGGLSMGLVFGRRAARTAVAELPGDATGDAAG